MGKMESRKVIESVKEILREVCEDFSDGKEKEDEKKIKNTRRI